MESRNGRVFPQETMKSPESWSISDGTFNAKEFKVDAETFSRSIDIIHYIPEDARHRYLAVEAVVYCYELCNPNIEPGSEIAQSMNREVAETAMADTDKSQAELTRTVIEADEKGLRDVPVAQALNQLFAQLYFEDEKLQQHSEMVQLRSLAVVSGLLLREKVGKDGTAA